MEYAEGTARHYDILDYDIHTGFGLMVEDLGVSVVTGLCQSRRLRVAAGVGDQFTQPFSLSRLPPEALVKRNTWSAQRPIVISFSQTGIWSRGGVTTKSHPRTV